MNTSQIAANDDSIPAVTNETSAEWFVNVQRELNQIRRESDQQSVDAFLKAGAAKPYKAPIELDTAELNRQRVEDDREMRQQWALQHPTKPHSERRIFPDFGK